MSKAQDQFYALAEMARISRPVLVEQTEYLGPDSIPNTKKVCMHESIWTDSELKAIKKKMIDCVKEMNDDNQSDNL